MRLWSLCLVALFACAGNPGKDLSIDLRTDFVPAGDFTSYVVTLDGRPSIQGIASTFQDYLSGVRVAEFDRLGTGTYAVRVDLLDLRGMAIATRSVSVDLQADTAITVVITRSCRGVSCPGDGEPASATSCIGGVCANPTCTPETPEACPATECSTADDCGASPQACLAARCASGTCLFGDDGSCGMNRFCDALRGCIERPTLDDSGVDAGADTGVDTGVDTAPDLCVGVTCVGFEECSGGMCVPFPGCFITDDCPGELRVCRNNHCVPADVDVDGDGSNATDDCDETNPDISPLATEICNNVDDDCDEMTDEGNPGLLCAMDPMGGECAAGACGCPAEQYDVDGVPDNGCECTTVPTFGTATTCAEATDLGNMTDVATGERATVMGNLVPDGREVWYSFRATDAPDTACDNFHVNVTFLTNPDDTYRLNVFRGSCATAVCPPTGFTEFSWATDFRSTLTTPATGECPCAVGQASPGNNICTDNSATFFVRVTRRDGAPVTCELFEIEVSNGAYDT